MKFYVDGVKVALGCGLLVTLTEKRLNQDGIGAFDTREYCAVVGVDIMCPSTVDYETCLHF